jgi:hypothetical protein
MAREAHGIVTNQSSSINAVFTAETHDCMDAGVRATQGAVAERAQRYFITETI